LKVLVTGVSGYLGGRIAEGLAAAGHRLRGMVRRPDAWPQPPAGSEIALGDVTDAASVQRAAEGCAAIVHAAALVKMWVADPREFERVNVQGLRHVLQAARDRGARVVYISSFIALGPTDGQVFDEDSPRSTLAFHNEYERTKWQADQIARQEPRDELAPVRIYPGVVYGPGRLTAGNHVVQLLLQHARGKLPGLLGAGDRRQSLTFVEDVVAGTQQAVERAPAGSGYILGGQNRTTLELFQAFERASGVPVPRRRIPFAAASLIGKLQRWRAALTGTEPQLTEAVVEIYRHEWSYASARAEQELGYRITPLEEGIARTVRWLQAIGEM
jgi:farnesol dehydrogenase